MANNGNSNKRQPTDLCLLCQKRPADKTGSHYTPIGLTKHVGGKRNYEHEITIAPSEGIMKDHYGRGNLANTNPVITQSDNVADYIFCTQCETDLQKWESACIEKLDKTQLGVSSATKSGTQQGIPYVSVNGVHANVLSLFIYSVIWRQILNNQLDYGTQFEASFVEKLRTIINEWLGRPIADIELSKAFTSYPPLILLASDAPDPKYQVIYGPNKHESNPELFFMGIVDALIQSSSVISGTFMAATLMPLKYVDKDLILSGNKIPRIGLMLASTWRAKTEFYFAEAADDYMAKYIQEVVDATGLSHGVAEEKLKLATKQISQTSQATQFDAYIKEVVESVINSHKKS